MKIKTVWAIQSLALCLLFNLVFTAVIFYMASRVIDASHQWVSALSASWTPAMPANVHKALGGLTDLIAQTRGHLTAVLSILAPAFTVLMWFFIFLSGSRQMRRSKVESQKFEVESQRSDVGAAEGGGVTENG
ncbi:MAG: hypothetical protein M0Z81_00100 [Deltaproteobacteria bacterium]|jgi:hypothetical protein|nr:hypothetical protein [Deltaproteobacteria bacterium]